MICTNFKGTFSNTVFEQHTQLVALLFSDVLLSLGCPPAVERERLDSVGTLQDPGAESTQGPLQAWQAPGGETPPDFGAVTPAQPACPILGCCASKAGTAAVRLRGTAERGGASMALSGQVCVVTGASRGIGKGIALQLSEAGATVYITGRGRESLERAAAEVRGRGGRCVPVVCDSTREDQVAALFQQVRGEQDGRLHLLVNNAFSGICTMVEMIGVPFWECDPSTWDQMNNAGLRGHYLCAVHAARLMVPAGRGLIVTISSPGGLRFMFDVPYGVGKAACDRLATDCAVELRPFGVASVALWPGLVRTETTQMKAEENSDPVFKKLREKLATLAESPEVIGKCVVGLASDPRIMSLSGKVLLSPDLAHRYQLRDVDGRDVFDYISLRNILTELMPKLSGLFRLIPQLIRIPKWVLDLYSSRFTVYPPIPIVPQNSAKKT